MMDVLNGIYSQLSCKFQNVKIWYSKKLSQFSAIRCLYFLILKKRLPPFRSQTAYTRHMQTVRTLKMFTVVVVVFACFALPNHINWILTDFARSYRPPQYLSKMFFVLTYVSSVVNCWIYGGREASSQGCKIYFASPYHNKNKSPISPQKCIGICRKQDTSSPQITLLPCTAGSSGTDVFSPGDREALLV